MDCTERDDWMYDEPAGEYVLRTHLDVRIVRLDVREPYVADWLVPFGDVEVDLGLYSPRFRAEDLTVEPLVMVGHEVEIPEPAGPRNDLTITSFQYYLALAVNPPDVVEAALKKARIRVVPRDD